MAKGSGKPSRDVAVGAIFALALIILAVTVMALGDGSNLFRNQVDYVVVFPTVEGMGIGSPVKMSGVQIGSVTELALSRDPSRSGINVRIGVDANYRQRIRQDSTAALRILQLLSGEKYVEIIPGTAASEELPVNSEIGLAQDRELWDAATEASENINDISVSLKNILDSLEAGEGMLGQMITDPDFGKEGLEAFRGALENVEGLTRDLRAGKGFVGRLLEDEEFAGKIDSLGDAVDGLARIVSRIDADEGAIGELLREDGSGKQAVKDLAEAAGSLKRVAASLESNKGFVGKLLNDEAYSEKLAADLQTLLANFAEVSTKINRGDGTLGALVNERTLYDGMEDVVAGVNDSKFARWLMRHYQKKGIKAPPKEAAGSE
jgi:phospholipid/cholesterol/gamma-HCH transport system substrate-binding protein